MGRVQRKSVLQLAIRASYRDLMRRIDHISSVIRVHPKESLAHRAGFRVQKISSLITVLHVFRHIYIVAQYYPFKLQYIHVQHCITEKMGS